MLFSKDVEFCRLLFKERTCEEKRTEYEEFLHGFSKVEKSKEKYQRALRGHKKILRDYEKMGANLDDSIVELRYRLMQEENNEYLEAARRKDLVEIADALGDKLYILCGTILAHGLQDKIVEVFNEIQKSNMSKLSIDGKPVIREDGKILKGPNYFKPNIKDILDS